MWIMCDDGSIINTNQVARFRNNGRYLIADIPGLPVSNLIVGKMDVKDITYELSKHGEEFEDVD